MMALGNSTPLILTASILVLLCCGLGYRLLRAGRSLRNEVRRGEQARQALSELQREHEKFVYITSHDLQEPVRAVESFSQLIVRRHAEKINAEVADLLCFVQQGAAKTRTMILALLEYSRACTAELHQQILDVDKLLTDVTEALDLREEFLQATFLKEPLPQVHADASQLRQLLAHLLDNAVRFAGSGVPQTIQIRARLVDGECHFTLSDQGIGIPESELDSIFEPFRRLSRDDESRSGMGLTICRQIVKRHGGRIWAESSCQGGARLHFTLPAVV